MPITSLIRKYSFGLTLATLYLIFVVLGSYLFSKATVIDYPDTSDYHAVTFEYGTSRQFWAGKRPLTTPLIWKAFNGSGETMKEMYVVVPYVYTFFSLLSWGLLALAVATVVRKQWLKYVSFVIILSIGLSKMVFFWNWVLLSESLYISFGVLVIALAILLLQELQLQRTLSRQRQTFLLIGAGSIIFLWLFSRDTNAFIALSAGIILAVYSVWKWRTIQPKILLSGIAILFIGLALFQIHTAKLGYRWQYPFVNVLSQRILPNPEYRNFFVQYGLPTNPETMRFAGGWANAHYYDWSGFNDWLNTDARSAYFAFLINHPHYTFVQPLNNWKDLIDGDWSIYGKRTVLDPIQNRITDLVWPRGPYLVLFALTAILISLWLALRRKVSSYLKLALVVLILVIPGVLITWHGDAAEIVRHSGGNGLQLRLALTLMIVFCLDSLSN